jgi:hypothetical protein
MFFIQAEYEGITIYKGIFEGITIAEKICGAELPFEGEGDFVTEETEEGNLAA